MPDRVKCLHVLVAHSLAMGRGVNPLGDEAVDALGEYFRGAGTPCVRLGTVGEAVDALPGFWRGEEEALARLGLAVAAGVTRPVGE